MCLEILSSRALKDSMRYGSVILTVLLLSVEPLTMETSHSKRVAFSVSEGLSVGDIIHVSDDFTTIQEAVDAAVDGDTVRVEAGIYEEQVVVDKNNLHIIGEGINETIVDGGGSGTVFLIEARNVTIRGFTIRHCTYGVRLTYSSNCEVLNNHVTLQKFGVTLLRSSNCSVIDNIVEDNEFNIRISDSFNNHLSGNKLSTKAFNLGIYGSSLVHFIQRIDDSNTANGKPMYYLMNVDGLTVDRDSYPNAGYLAIVNSSRVTVKDLTLTNNVHGVLLAYTSDSSVENVTVITTKVGIGLYRSLNCSVSENKALYNPFHGVLLSGSSHCEIVKNNVTGNTEGIYLTHSNSCNLHGNTLERNDIGLKIVRSYDNSFHGNDMIDNMRQFYIDDASGNNFDDGVKGNHWSDHEGVDLKKGPGQDQPGSDGLADTPYVIDGNHSDRYPLMVTLDERACSLSLATNVSTSLSYYTIEVKGRLSAERELSISEAPVLLSYSLDRGETWSEITQVNTSSRGSYTVNWTPEDTGIYLFRASWGGSIIYTEANTTINLAAMPFEESVLTIASNSTVSELSVNHESRELGFTLEGSSGTTGYVNVTLGKSLILDINEVKLYLDGEQTSYEAASVEDTWIIRFTYQLSIHSAVLSLGPAPRKGVPETSIRRTPVIVEIATLLLPISIGIIAVILKNQTHPKGV